MKAAGRILILSAVMGLQLTPAWADSGKEPALLINEVMQANIDMFLDPSFNYGSWIELYNTTDQDISIADFWLSTTPDRSWADTLRYSMHEGIQSIGLYPDGGKKLYVMNRPTMGAANFRSWFDITEKESRVLTGYVPVKSDTGNSRIYNLLGMPVHTPVHGQMYIRDGKKFFYR